MPYSIAAIDNCYIRPYITGNSDVHFNKILWNRVATGYWACKSRSIAGTAYIMAIIWTLAYTSSYQVESKHIKPATYGWL